MRLTFLFLMLLPVALTAAPWQQVPSEQISFPTSDVYYAISPTSDVAYEVFLDLDSAISNAGSQVSINTANIVSNAANIASNAANIASNAANIASNSSGLATVSSNFYNFSTQVWSVCSADTTISVDNAMSVTEINALGSSYDFLPRGVTLTYLFSAGVYTNAGSILISDMVPPGDGSVRFLGSYTSVTSPETVIWNTSGGPCFLRNNYYSSTGDSSFFGTVLMQGFTTRGNGVANSTYGIVTKGNGGALVLRSPMRFEDHNRACVVAEYGSHIIIQAWTNAGGSTVPMYIDAPSGGSTLPFGDLHPIFASGRSIITASTSAGSTGDDVIVFEGGDNYTCFLSAYDSSLIDFYQRDINITSGSTASGNDDIELGAFSKVRIATPGDYGVTPYQDGANITNISVTVY